jgi:hypothetical protein
MAVMKFVVYRRVEWSGVEWRCDNDITPSTLTPQQVYPVPFIEWCKLGTGQWEGAHPADMQRRLISLLLFGMEVKLPYGTTRLSLSPSSQSRFKEIDRLLRNLAPVLCHFDHTLVSFDHTPVSFEITILKEYFAQFVLPV